MKLLLTFSLLLLCCASAQATDYYASTSGSGSTCSVGSPCSINTVMTKPTAGDTVILRVGTYTVDSTTWDSLGDGTNFSSGAITIKPFTGETVTFIGIVGDHIINLRKGQHYIIFQDLILDGVSKTTSYNGVKITGDGSSSAQDAHHIRFLRCEVKNTQFSGILIAPTFAGGGQGNEIQYCNIHHTGTRALDHGVYVESSLNLVENCNIHDITLGYGIQLDNAVGGDNNIFRLNTIHDNPAAGIILSYGSGNLVYNNVIYNSTWGINADVLNSAGIYNNTIYNATYPLYFYSANAAGSSKNNILITNATYCVFIESGSAAQVIQNNLCLKTSGANGAILNNGSGGNSQIINNILTGTAAFVNAGGADFHIGVTSTAIGAGLDLSAIFTTDKDGVTRTVPWDIGAYEFSGGSWYVRADGSTTTNCTGLANAAYPGSGTGQACAYSNPQDAINAAACGDIISVRAGDTYSGSFNLPNKSCSTYVTIQSSALASLSAGAQVSPSRAVFMPLFRASSNNTDVFHTAASADYYKLLGLEISQATGVSTQNALIELGNGTQTSLAVVPENYVIDRCYIHAFSATSTARRGIALNSGATTVSNSYISGFKEVGADSQAILGYNGPGPFTITNNYLEAAGENILFGGADTTITNLIPSSITVEGNTFYKQPAWNPASGSYAGIAWSVKNGFELKNANLVTLNQNTFDNIFCASQQHTIVLTPRNQNNTNPWAVVKNITITNNTVSNSCAFINISAEDDNFSSAQLTDVVVQNNLAYSLAASNPAITINSQTVTGGAKNLTFNHNTIMGQSTMVETTGTDVSTGFVFTNNIMPLGPSDIGFHCSGDGTGTTCLSSKFTGYTWDKNVLIGTQQVPYPATTYFPVNNAAVGFVNAAAFNFALLSSSSYHNAATDGTDIGAIFGNTQPSSTVRGKFTIGGKVIF